MDQFAQTEVAFLGLLIVVVLVALAVRRLRIPYTVALVVVGLLITGQEDRIELTPDLVLYLFVPPLVFEAALNLNWANLRRNLPAVLLFAGPGVLLTMAIVGGVLGLATSLTLSIAFVFGALISATDPVSVVAIFRSLGVPRRLATLVEGESLLNDGTAIVVFNLAVAAAVTGTFSAIDGVVDFIRVAAGGVVIGVALGWLISQVIARIDDYLIETTLTTVLAFGSYLVADRVDVSGVLAVVAAGLVVGNAGPRGMSPTTRIVLFNFWEYVAFLANSLVFLLIGLEVDVPALWDERWFVLWAIVAVALSRVVVAYGVGAATRLVGPPVPLNWMHVLNWSGLRGALSLALALSLPAALADDRARILAMAVGVVLFTLLVEGMTIRPLLQRLGLVGIDEAAVDFEVRRARVAATRAAGRRLEELHRDGLISTPTWETLKPKVEQQTEALDREVRAAVTRNPSFQADELSTAHDELLRARRSALLEIRHDGAISEDAYLQLSAEIDRELDHTAPATEPRDTAERSAPPQH